MIGVPKLGTRSQVGGITLPSRATYLMVVLIIVFGMYVIGPTLLIFVNSFDVAGIGESRDWSLGNWRLAFSTPDIFTALGNTFMIFGIYTGISFPLAVLIAWAIARTKVKWAYSLEFMFWVSSLGEQISTSLSIKDTSLSTSGGI